MITLNFCRILKRLLEKVIPFIESINFDAFHEKLKVKFRRFRLYEEIVDNL